MGHKATKCTMPRCGAKVTAAAALLLLLASPIPCDAFSSAATAAAPVVPAMHAHTTKDSNSGAGKCRHGIVQRRSAMAVLPCLIASSFFLTDVRRANAQLYVPSDGDELAPVAKDGKPSPVVLVPLLQAQQRLKEVAELIEANNLDSWRDASSVLRQKPFTPTKELKRLFNAYTDNIYFSDASRKNMYLDGSAMLGMGKSTFGFGTLAVGSGGASPESKDTETYLYRNEVLNNVDALTAEVAYLVKQADAGIEESSDDLFLYLRTALENFDKYLANIPDRDLDQARAYV